MNPNSALPMDHNVRACILLATLLSLSLLFSLIDDV